MTARPTIAARFVMNIVPAMSIFLRVKKGVGIECFFSIKRNSESWNLIRLKVLYSRTKIVIFDLMFYL